MQLRGFLLPPPAREKAGVGVGTPSILGSSPIPWPRPSHPYPPPRGGREIRAPDATGTYRIFNGTGPNPGES